MRGRDAVSGEQAAGSPAGKITAVLFIAQCLGSAGFIAMSTVGAILAAQLSGERSWAGVPSAASALAGAGAAFLWGYLMDSLGRRGALVLGLLSGAVGAAASIIAIVHGSFLLFVAGMVLVGIAQAAVTLSRFMAAEVNRRTVAARAISYVVLGGTVGAVLGPLLVAPSGRLMTGAGANELAGAFAAAAILLAAAGVVVFLALRPDPREIGRALSDSLPHPDAGRPARRIGAILRRAGCRRGRRLHGPEPARHGGGHGHHIPLHEGHEPRPGRRLDRLLRAHNWHVRLLTPFRKARGPLGTGARHHHGSARPRRGLPDGLFSGGHSPSPGACSFSGWGGTSALWEVPLSCRTSLPRRRGRGHRDSTTSWWVLPGGVGSFGSGVVSSAIGYGGVGLTGAALSLVPLLLVVFRSRMIRKAAI